MRPGIIVDVTPSDRRQLEAIVADRNAPQKHVWRAKIILATADGCGTAHVYLMGIYKNPTYETAVRMEAAKAALPYEKPRLSPIGPLLNFPLRSDLIPC